MSLALVLTATGCAGNVTAPKTSKAASSENRVKETEPASQSDASDRVEKKYIIKETAEINSDTNVSIQDTALSARDEQDLDELLDEITQDTEEPR